jgi:hemerythrin-like domain-containing protein
LTTLKAHGAACPYGAEPGLHEDAEMDALYRSYDHMLDICNRLENIADSLPAHINATSCAALAIELPEALQRTHDEEERALLPILSVSKLPELRNVASRLRREHALDQVNAMEIRETLLALASNRLTLSGDAAGYQLRAFFESLRRHVSAEQDILALLGHVPSSNGSVH